jgi:hypothetical protein
VLGYVDAGLLTRQVLAHGNAELTRDGAVVLACNALQPLGQLRREAGGDDASVFTCMHDSTQSIRASGQIAVWRANEL